MRRLRTIYLVVLAASGTMCSAPPSHGGDETEAAPTGGDEPPAQGTEGSADEDSMSAAHPEENAGTEEGVSTAPTVSTRISFDLRGMPHRGPYDVDPRLIDARRGHLMQRVRDAAGEPSPRVVLSVGTTSFTVEFFGPEAQALAQCQHIVAEVAPPPAPHISPRMAVSLPTATPCVAMAPRAP